MHMYKNERNIHGIAKANSSIIITDNCMSQEAVQNKQHYLGGFPIRNQILIS